MHTHETQSRRESCVFSFNHLILIIIIIIIIITKTKTTTTTTIIIITLFKSQIILGNRTRDTLVEGERSHHCANPAPRYLYEKFKLIRNHKLFLHLVPAHSLKVSENTAVQVSGLSKRDSLFCDYFNSSIRSLSSLIVRLLLGGSAVQQLLFWTGVICSIILEM